MKLTRSNDKIIAGVASGLAESLGVDPTVVRIAFGVLTLLGMSGVGLYIVLWIIMPNPEGDSGLQYLTTEFKKNKTVKGDTFDPYKD